MSDVSATSTTAGGPTDLTAQPLIEATAITRSFPPVVALQDVDFSVARGEVHTLAGENGSGKSTLLKILAGAQPPDSGSVQVAGRPLPPGDVRAARAAGVALVTQEGSMLPELTVAENIFLGLRRFRARGRIDWSRARHAAAEVLGRLELDVDPGRTIASLSTDVRQLVEIARAIATDAQVLLLDEPTSSLDLNEVAGLFSVLRRLRNDGVGIVFVSHRMAELTEISDRVTVLRDGRRVAEAKMAKADEAWLVRNMVGRDAPTFTPRARQRVGQVALRAEGLCDRLGRVRDVTLEVRSGEIVGLAGLVGAGRTELLETVVGARPRERGTVELDGVPLVGGTREAIARGIVLLTEDRKATGAVGEMSLRDNLLLSGRQPGHALRRRRAETGRLDPWLTRLGVRGGGLDAPIGSLSGGNQQKVLLGRSLVTEPRVVLLDEPTRGIDIGAKTELGRVIGDLADAGAAVLMASSELPEILAICDRVLVVRGGEVVAELDRAELSEERIVQEAIGAGALVA